VLFMVVTGALLELAGIGLAMREVIHRRRGVRAHENRPGSGYGVGFLTAGVGTLTAEGSSRSDGPPSLEQRVEALESAVPALRDELKAAEQRARDSAQHVAGTLTKALDNHLTQTIEGVRRLLLDVTRPSVSAWLSIGLLSGGLALQSIANVVQVVQVAS
jgi:hypothetical protein